MDNKLSPINKFINNNKFKNKKNNLMKHINKKLIF